MSPTEAIIPFIASIVGAGLLVLIGLLKSMVDNLHERVKRLEDRL